MSSHSSRSKKHSISYFDSLLDYLGRLFHLPILSELKADLQDPFSAKTAKEMKRIAEKNVTTLRKKMANIYRISGKRKKEWQTFMHDSTNFTSEQWEKLQQMHQLLDHFSLSNGIDNGKKKTTAQARPKRRERKKYWRKS